MSKYYFAVEDGCYDPETGKTCEAGVVVDAEGFDSIAEAERFVISHLPNFTARIRRITKEEYERDYE